MMNYCVLFALLQALITVQSIGGDNDVEKVELDQNCHLECLIDAIGFLYSEEEAAADTDGSREFQGDDLFLCRLKNDAFRSRAGYRVALPPHFVKPNREDLSSATATICISSGEVDRENNKINIADDAEITLLAGRRKLQTIDPILGKRSILAVQLTTSFMSGNGQVMESPGMSKSEISGSIFGVGPNSPGHDLTSQYRDCSFGALDLVPATGTNIEYGVAEVRLRKPIAGGEILGSLQDDILEATEERVGSLDQFDHIIYCIPDDALMDGAAKWTAFTYFHSHWSFFQKRRCSAMSVTIHELGHNLGFRHSGFKSEAYGDESGYMGFTIYQSGGPVKCFNGHKNWVAKWFDDRAYRVNPYMLSPVLTRLVTFVDYKKDLELDDVVLIRVGPYFIQYNRAKGINVDTGMHADQVSITKAQDAEADSEAIIGLGAGQKAILTEYRSTGYSLVVEVCDMGTTGQDTSLSSLARQTIFGQPNNDPTIDYAWVSIHLENGQQRSQCGRVVGRQEIPQLTSEPTSSPPSSRPTQPPTPKPSLKPTASPVAGHSSGQDRRPSDGFASDFSVQEKIQKKRQVRDIKDIGKLRMMREEEPAVRRRLKGTR